MLSADISGLLLAAGAAAGNAITESLLGSRLAAVAAAAPEAAMAAAGGRGGGPERVGAFCAELDCFGVAADDPTRDKSGALSRFAFGS